MLSPNITVLTTVKLFTLDGEASYDIKQSVSQIMIEESIFNMSLYGSATIIDVNDDLERFNLNSDWYIQISFLSGIGKYEESLIFKISGIDNIKRESMQKRLYVLKFVSPEALDNLNQRISKGYSGTKSAIISDLLQKLTKKPLLIKENNNTTSLLCPKMHPFDAIDLMLLYNKSDTDYLFWESFRGFNCNSISALLSSNSLYSYKDVDISTMSEKDILKSADIGNDPHIIKSFTVDSLFDEMEARKTGYKGSTSYTYNPIAGVPFNYKVNEEFADNIHYIDLTDRLNFKGYIQRHKILSELEAHEWFFTVPGNYTISSGDPVYVAIQKQQNNPGFSSLLSGIFIIVSIKHKFTLNSYTQEIGVSR
jgi:hypothetical protein